MPYGQPAADLIAAGTHWRTKPVEGVCRGSDRLGWSQSWRRTLGR